MFHTCESWDSSLVTLSLVIDPFTKVRSVEMLYALLAISLPICWFKLRSFGCKNILALVTLINCFYWRVGTFASFHSL